MGAGGSRDARWRSLPRPPGSRSVVASPPGSALGGRGRRGTGCRTRSRASWRSRHTSPTRAAADSGPSGSVAPWRRSRVISARRASSRARPSSRPRTPSQDRCPSKDSWRRETRNRRGSRAASASRRSGSYRAIASSRHRSTVGRPAEWATGARCRSTNRAASAGSSARMVRWAIRRARQASTSRVWTRAHNRGRRWRSSRASPIRAAPASVRCPIRVASSATQNSATRGAPGPATVTPVSP